MRLRRLAPATVLPALVLVLAGSLSACGGDDEPADGGSGSNGSASSPDGPSDEELDALDEGIDEALSSTPLDTIASSIDSVLDNVSGYEINGDEITLFAEGSSESSSVCAIAGTVLGSFDIPEGTTLTVEFDDGDVACDI